MLSFPRLRMVRFLVAFLVLLSMLPVGAAVFAVPPAEGAFARTWSRTDAPVADGTVARTWMWGPDANTEAFAEPYLESGAPGRLVQYYDKSRMEITHPEAVDDGVWYVTNGLLVVELITGRLQLGDEAFLPLTPAQIPVAGDVDDPIGPTYATFNAIEVDEVMPLGATYLTRLNRDGSTVVDGTLATRGVTAAQVDPVTGHAIAAPFWEFMQARGPVLVNDRLVEDALVADPLFAVGRPVSEAYWAWVRIAGAHHDVLVQCFERRCLTYAPDNPAGWQVEAGNVGLHYHAWRYESGFQYVIQWVDAEVGGTVALGEASIELPPGALSRDTLVTIVSVESGPPPAQYTPVGPAYALGLSGATLLEPVTVTLPYDVDLLPDGTTPEHLLAGRSGDEGEWEVLAGSATDGTLSVVTSHLSTWQVFAPGQQPNTPPVAFELAVTVIAGGTVNITLQGFDADGDSLTYTILTQPQSGTLSGTPPNLQYTAPTGAGGIISFTYRVNDGQADSNVATVVILVTVPNATPAAHSQAVSVNAGESVAITLTGSDADGDALTYAIVNGPQHGTLTGTPPHVTYTPAPGYVGPDSFTFRVNDGTADSNVATVSISVVEVPNVAPVAEDGNERAVPIVATTLELVATDTDSAALTFEILQGPTDGTLDTLTPAATCAPLGNGVRCTAEVVYTSSHNASGLDSFTWRASDGELVSNTATMTIEREYDPPAIYEIDAAEGGTIEIPGQVIIIFGPGVLACDAIVTIQGGPGPDDAVTYEQMVLTSVGNSYLIEMRPADPNDPNCSGFVAVNGTITLGLWYDPAAIPGERTEDEVTIGVEDDFSPGFWFLFSSLVDTENNIVYTETETLSRWTPFIT
jgi:hypothetical protein